MYSNLNLRSTFPADKMSLATLEHLTAALELLKANLEKYFSTKIAEIEGRDS